jgi:uncharacterized membrane protein
MRWPLAIPFSRLVLIVFAGTLLAALAHILIIFTMPLVAPKAAVARIGANLEVNKLHLMSASDRSAIPYADPAMATAACPFDLTDTPVRLRIITGEDFLSVVFLGESGRILTSLTDKAATRRVLDMRIVTDQQLRQLEAQDPDDEPVQEIRLSMSEPRGVAVIRVFAPRESARSAAEVLLARVVCRPDAEG